MRQPDLEEVFRKSYIPESVATDVESSPETVTAQAVPIAYPQVQPMKAALYFDSVEGFGEWQIYLSTRANKNMRETRRKDPALFEIIVKKIE